MASLKDATKSALEDRSPRFLLGTIALGVVISLIVGFGIGYAAHTGGGGSSKKATKAAANKAKAKAKKKAKAGAKRKVVAAPDLTGGIFAVKPSSITVLNAKQKGVKISIGHNKRVALTKAGNASNIVIGSKLVYRPSAKDPTKATQVIILPAKALIGSPITAVDAGNSVTVQDLTGTKKITTKGATVWVTATGTKKNLIRREVVTVRYFLVGAKKKATATQVVVMPTPPKVG